MDPLFCNQNSSLASSLGINYMDEVVPWILLADRTTWISYHCVGESPVTMNIWVSQHQRCLSQLEFIRLLCQDKPGWFISAVLSGLAPFPLTEDLCQWTLESQPAYSSLVYCRRWFLPRVKCVRLLEMSVPSSRRHLKARKAAIYPETHCTKHSKKPQWLVRWLDVSLMLLCHCSCGWGPTL